jgi:ribosomal protein S18 acetylase RimI-like enzyme
MGDLVILDGRDSDVPSTYAADSHRIYSDLVKRGAALGWVSAPSADEVVLLLKQVMDEADHDDAVLRFALQEGIICGLAYWRRYSRPTHRPHADVERVAVSLTHQGKGVGRRLTANLVDAARSRGIEKLTLDVRGDNVNAISLYRSMGFVQYGTLRDFVAIGEKRYDKLFFVLDLQG